MLRTYKYEPLDFFLITFFISWASWFFAIYASWQPSLQYLLFPLILGGMSGPTISAFIMLIRSKNKSLWSDFFQRLSFKMVKIRFIPIALLLIPCLVLLAIANSLFFGFSSQQFSLTFPLDQALQGMNFLALLIAVFLSCSLEEIGWRGYGIDSLNSRFNLWKTSLVFAAIWSLWHVPAFFIKNGYFEKEVLSLGFMYVATYFLSLFPIALLINWLYIKNNRSILIAILFHAIMNLSYGLFQIQPFTRIIFMLLLFLVAGVVVVMNKELFFKTPHEAKS
jgi:membrane protease YdiL (CAAX protease family)